MSNPALKRMKHTAVYEENSPVLNTDTAEMENVWAEVTATSSVCRFIPGSSRDILDHDADLSVERLIVPGDLLINGSLPDKTIHRIGSITSNSGKVIDGSFLITHIADRENGKGQRMLYTFYLERVT